MPRRRVLTEAQLETLLALPTTEADLVRHWTLSPADHAAIRAPPRRPQPARLCPAALCAPLSRPPAASWGGHPGAGAALRGPASSTWIPALSPPMPRGSRPATSSSMPCVGLRLHRARNGRSGANCWPGCCRWRSPPRGAAAIAAALMDELRRRQIIAPGPSVIERLVAAAVLMAERHVAGQLTRGLPADAGSSARCAAADQGGHVDERAGLGPPAAGSAGPSRAGAPR